MRTIPCLFPLLLSASLLWAQAPGKGKAAAPSTRPDTRPDISAPVNLSWAHEESCGIPCPAVEPSAKQDYIRVEQMPTPPGGFAAYWSALRQLVVVPAGPPRTGKVFVNFIVTASGQLTRLTVTKGLAPAYDAEALRVVGLLQPWTPGCQSGQTVRVSYTVPVAFGSD